MSKIVDKPILEYATPEPPATARQRRRTGMMGLFLGVAWVPSEMVYHPTPSGRILSLLMFAATIALILIVHRGWSNRERRNL
jgi:hypothetical protein